MCTRKIKRKKGVQFKELIEVSLFLLLHFFWLFFIRFVAMFNNVFCSPAKSKYFIFRSKF